jgi:hypothetical protein
VGEEEKYLNILVGSPEGKTFFHIQREREKERE